MSSLKLMHGVFQRCAVKPYAAERLEVISRTDIFSLYFMIQRLELLFLQSQRVDTALPFSELILVLFQSSIGLLRYYFVSPFAAFIEIIGGHFLLSRYKASSHRFM
jgi:hypothetical protein